MTPRSGDEVPGLLKGGGRVSVQGACARGGGGQGQTLLLVLRIMRVTKHRAPPAAGTSAQYMRTMYL